MQVRLFRDQKIKVLNAHDLYKVMQQVLLRQNKIRRGQEHFWVVGLNNANTILFVELVALGASNRVHAHPPEVFRMAIYKLATQLVLVHNHPGGETKASDADKNFTDHMLKAGNLINIDVIDHLVITETAFFSFAKEGLMDKLRRSGKFEIVSKEREELTEIKLEAERTKKAVSIATKMRRKGYSVAEIQELTGLKKAEIGKLK